ncbi:MAG: diadenylate cyclase CdaA [Proteobacteria bacterium]|nr:diadenylate cyclase CdaA [Pseudomonadota bacterium]
MTVLRDWIAHSPFGTATWVDYVDVLLLAWLIYAALMLIRGTRAIRSLLGLGILALIYLGAYLSGLSTVHWLLDHLFVYLILAVLILFQEDIRRALAQAGATFARRGRTSEVNLREEVVQAVFSLAGRRIGAIIAIERTASLSPFLEGTHLIDAAVSTELLQAIFHPSSPIHDGAVVISDGRLAAAGVFFPITVSPDVSKAFGTRHRAAMRVTDETDAICLVVSEERGTVAIVEGGHMIPVADAKELRELLQQELEREVIPESAEVVVA